MSPCQETFKIVIKIYTICVYLHTRAHACKRTWNIYDDGGGGGGLAPDDETRTALKYYYYLRDTFLCVCVLDTRKAGDRVGNQFYLCDVWLRNFLRTCSTLYRVHTHTLTHIYIYIYACITERERTSEIDNPGKRLYLYGCPRKNPYMRRWSLYAYIQYSIYLIYAIYSYL